MNTRTHVTVLGAGGWGTAIAHLCADAGLTTLLWGRDPGILDAIATRRRNDRYLAGLDLAPGIAVEHDLAKAIDASDIVLGCVPAQHTRPLLLPHRDRLAGKLYVNTAKGIEMGTNFRVSEVLAEVAPRARYAILSGPSFAPEVVRRLPTVVTIASSNKEDAVMLQNLLRTDYFRSYVSTDVAGVELAGALKNVIAIAAGIVVGLDLGFNAQAALINRGLMEVARLGRKLGAEPLTFLGLSGMGDLVLTCTGPLSRNRRFGEMLGLGKTRAEADQALDGVVEGVFTVKAALALGQKLDVELPIIEQVHKIVHDGADPRSAVAALMRRDFREELL